MCLCNMVNLLLQSTTRISDILPVVHQDCFGCFAADNWSLFQVFMSSEAFGIQKTHLNKYACLVPVDVLRIKQPTAYAYDVDDDNAYFSMSGWDVWENPRHFLSVFEIKEDLIHHSVRTNGTGY